MPLLFELSLLGTLAWLLNESEKEARQLDRSKMVIAGTNGVIQLLFDVSFAFLAFDARKMEIFRDHLDKSLSKIPSDMADLKELVKENPEHLHLVKTAEFETNKCLEWIRDTVKKSESGERLNIPEALIMRRRLNKIVGELDQIIKDEKLVQRKKPKSADNLKRVLKILLVSGFIVSILLAVLLVVIFHKSTTRRLQSLIRNSVYLGQGKPLTPPLDGNDEIAIIDLTFHAAADKLEQAALKRAELENLKKQFVAMISHDLRTPITSVTSTLELLGANAWGTLTPQGLTKVNMAETSLRHSIELINNLLDLEKMEAGSLALELKNVEMMRILEKASYAVLPLAEKKSINLDMPISEDVTILADDFRLTQVMINLLGNAIKFSPPSTTVKVEILEDPEMVTVSITDQGPGVSPEHEKLIFERFHQAPETSEKAKQGTGLGLAICKAIIEAHGGSIGVSSYESPGSRFWFKLKKATDKA